MIQKLQSRDFMALVTPMAKIKRRNHLKADLYRLRQIVGESLKAGVTSSNDFILFTTDTVTWRRLVKLLPFMIDFHEQRIDPIRTKIELLEVVDEDSPLFT